jgi:hypothetical protein
MQQLRGLIAGNNVICCNLFMRFLRDEGEWRRSLHHLEGSAFVLSHPSTLPKRNPGGRAIRRPRV